MDSPLPYQLIASESVINQSSLLFFDKCIKCYQRDISLLKKQNLQLEQLLTKSNEPNSSLVQSYKMEQMEREQLYKENIQLKKSLLKYQTLNKQKQLIRRKETEESLISKNISLLSENKHLKAQIEKKNIIIEKLKSKYKEKDSSFKLLSNQYTILMQEKQLVDNQNVEKIKNINDQENTISNHEKKQSGQISIKEYNKICKIVRQLKTVNEGLCNTIENQKKMIDQLISENNLLKNSNNQLSKEEDKNNFHDISLLQEKLKRIEREKNVLHDRIDQNEITIKQLQSGNQEQLIQKLNDALKECEELKSKNSSLQQIIEENSEKILLFPKSEEKNKNETQIQLSNSDKEEELSYIKINPINVTNDQEILANDGNIVLVPFNKNDPSNINITINLKIKNEQDSFFNEEEENENQDEIVFDEEESLKEENYDINEEDSNINNSIQDEVKSENSLKDENLSSENCEDKINKENEQNVPPPVINISVSELKSQLEKAQNQYEDEKQLYESSKEELIQLQNRIQNLRDVFDFNNLDDLKDKLEKTKKYISETEKRDSEIEQEMYNLRKQNEMQNNKIHEYQINNIENIINELHSLIEFQDFVDFPSILAKELRSLKDEINEELYSSSFHDQQSTESDQENICSSYNEDLVSIGNLQKELNNAKKSLEKLEKENKSNLEKQQVVIKQCGVSSLEELSSLFESLKVELENTKNNINELIDSNSSILNENDEIISSQDQLNEIEKQFIDENHEKETILKEIDDIKSILDCDSICNLKQKIVDLQMKVSQSERKDIESKQLISSHENELSKLHQQCEQQKKQIQLNIEQLDKLSEKQKNNDKHFSELKNHIKELGNINNKTKEIIQQLHEIVNFQDFAQFPSILSDLLNSKNKEIDGLKESYNKQQQSNESLKNKAEILENEIKILKKDVSERNASNDTIINLHKNNENIMHQIQIGTEQFFAILEKINEIEIDEKSFEFPLDEEMMNLIIAQIERNNSKCKESNQIINLILDQSRRIGYKGNNSEEALNEIQRLNTKKINEFNKLINEQKELLDEMNSKFISFKNESFIKEKELSKFNDELQDKINVLNSIKDNLIHFKAGDEFDSDFLREKLNSSELELIGL